MQELQKRYDVHWYGPFDFDALLKGTEDINENHVLYMICGTHGLYGRSVPLYIGKTEQTIRKRMSQHRSWVNSEPDEVKVYTACIGEFTSWDDWQKKEEYPPLGSHIIETIESLLIVAHQCAYNSRSKAQKSCGETDIAVFNTGRRSTLYPEVSSLYWAPAKRNDHVETEVLGD